MKTDNELIADFMQLQVSKGVHNDNRIYYKIPFYHDSLIAPMDDFRYHISWDWLIPVIEKIESDPLNDVCIFKEATQIRRWNGEHSIFDWKILEPDGGSKIAHVYRAVVKYIDQHNKQKQ